MSQCNLIKNISTVVVLTSTLLLVSCGGASYQEPANGATAANSVTSNPGNNTVTTVPSPLPTVNTGSLPPITSSFTVTGSGGTSPSYSINVNTDNLLQVTITAGAATNVIPGSNFSATYGCVTYTVSALGETVTTQTLGVSGGNAICPNAPASQTIDFSGRLTSGHASVPITVTASGYDFYCQGCLTYPWLYNAYPYGYYSCSMYCPLHTVFKNHGITGTLSITVNGTTN